MVKLIFILLQEVINNEISQKAHQFLATIIKPDFILALNVTEKVFTFTLPLCKYLQKIDCDLTKACDHVQVVIDSLNTLRQNAEVEFNLIFITASKTLTDVGGTMSVPRLSKKQINRDNYTESTPEEYYRKALFIPFLDHSITHLKSKFEYHHDLILSFQNIMPNKVVFTNEKDVFNLWDFYKTILSDHQQFNSEYLLWKSKWVKEKEDCRPSSAFEAFLKCDSDFFPNIKQLLTIISTLPVSTTTAERTFSTLRRIKSYLRNSTGNERLTGLALLSVHREINIDLEEVINIFKLHDHNYKWITLKIGMVFSMSIVSLAILIFEFLCVVINSGAGHHVGHHAGHHTNHGHHARQGHIGGGVGKRNRYGGHGGNSCRHDHGHVASGGHRNQALSMHRSGDKNPFNPAGYLNFENKKPRSSAHAKKKGHADITHSQTTSKEVNPVKSVILDAAKY
ncbi:52 kDa repressor of the inhibitor of the protein kinase-like [Melanaphis sacchari]|uniref:52 kDa repressor of the inhibitor of the protein kinase-like n=1 Tax=Melanaphis sacchari TaxID=742174 RepID=UPI000DC136FB|nr:52 kDa repressor of the inhibitor of the protein kinase-like [Melanaphis sacchari]